MKLSQLRKVIVLAVFSALPAISVAAFDIQCTRCDGNQFSCINNEQANVYNWVILSGQGTWVTADGLNGRSGECTQGGNISGIVTRDNDFTKVESFIFENCNISA